MVNLYIDDIPVINLTIQLFDHAYLWAIKAVITGIKEDAFNSSLPIFYYLIKLKRNDGLEWQVSRRYSEFRRLYKTLSSKSNRVNKFFFRKKI